MSKKYELSIGAIVKDETLYLPEWLEFHKMVGVQHFFIYDNESAIPVAETLKHDIADGVVTVIPFPGRAQQFSAYGHCLHHFRNESTWIAFVDADEFLVPAVCDDLKDILKDYEKFGALAVNWALFGTSGHKERPQSLQAESYTWRLPDTHGLNLSVKLIVRPDRAIGVQTAHIFSFQDGFHTVNEEFQRVNGAYCQFSCKKLRINHYNTRSVSEYQAKVRRGRVDINQAMDPALLNQIDSACKVEDKEIFRFLVPLKERLASRK